jgi:hypothetical protein
VSELPAAIVPATELKEHDRRYVEELVRPTAAAEPLKVKPDRVAPACDARFGALLAKSQPATVLRVDAVDAKQGTALWSIERTVLDAEGPDGRVGAEHQTRTWTAVYHTDLVGPSLALSGAVLALGPVYLPWFGGPTDSEESQTTIKVMAISGVAVAAVGLVMLLAGPGGIRTHHDRVAHTCRAADARFRIPTPGDARRARRLARELGERTFAELDLAMRSGSGG